MSKPSVDKLEQKSRSLLHLLSDVETGSGYLAPKLYDEAARLLHHLTEKFELLKTPGLKIRVRETREQWLTLMPAVEYEALRQIRVDEVMSEASPSVVKLELSGIKLARRWQYLKRKGPYLDTAAVLDVEWRTRSLLNVLEKRKHELVSERFKNRISVAEDTIREVIAEIDIYGADIPVNHAFVRWIRKQADALVDRNPTSPKLANAYVKPTESSDPAIQAKLNILRRG